MPPLLSVRGLTKAFPQPDGRPPTPVLDGLSFEVGEGEPFALLGPSGCGKTTALRVLAGVERPDGGAVALAGRLLDGGGRHVPPERRGVGLVFQDYALFPHLTVAEHVAFGLRGMARAEREGRVGEVVRLVGLDGLEGRLPHALSGGQQQRVALARAVAPRPRLLLLDEPFSSLDAGLRHETRDRVRDLARSLGMTALLVTHDQEEALAFARRVAVMRGGRVDQVGTPEEVYRAPRTRFVAEFLGRTNVLPAEADGATARTALGPLRLSRPASGPVSVSLRPEHLALDPEAHGDGGQRATVLARDYWGHDVTYRVGLADARQPGGPVEVLVHTDARAPYAVGDAVRVRAVEPAVVLDDGAGAPPPDAPARPAGGERGRTFGP